MLGNICFSEQIFHRKQSLGASVVTMSQKVFALQTKLKLRLRSMLSIKHLRTLKTKQGIKGKKH